jgi:hypothetical protein
VLKLKTLITILFLAIASLQSARGQLLHAYGATIGLTRSTEVFNYNNPDLRQTMGYRSGFNGSLFLEFFNHPVFTWVMEAQFNQFGSRWLDADGAETFRHRLNYGSFNNFLKARAEGIDINLYAIAGPRVQYLLSANAPDASQLAFSVSGGLGCDFNFFEPVILFTEVHYVQGFFGNSDVMERQNRAFEFRIGIKKLIQKRRDDCPPVLL